MANFAVGKPVDVQAAYDEARIRKEAADQEAMKRKALAEQTSIQAQRLQELQGVLAKQQSDTFNRDIPGIAETAQGKGMLESSGFGNALADRYKSLTQDTSSALAKQALSDRDLQVAGIGDITKDTAGLDTNALERSFSLQDQGRSEDLARELAKYGVSSPAQGPTTLDKAGQIVQIGAGLTQIGAGK